MNRKASFISAAAVIFGIAGYLLRAWELQTGFNTDAGLAVSGASAHTAIIIFSAVAVAAAVLAASLLSRRNGFGAASEETFSCRGSFLPLLGAAGGLAILAGAVLYGFRYGGSGIFMEPLPLIFAVAAAVSGIVETALFLCCASGRKAGGLGNFSVILPLFFCFWLLLLYKDNSTDPTILDYCFTALALAAISLSLYYAAGFFFGRGRPGAFLFTHLTALYFGILSLADMAFDGTFLMMLGVLAAILCELILFLRNLSPRENDRTNKAQSE